MKGEQLDRDKRIKHNTLQDDRRMNADEMYETG